MPDNSVDSIVTDPPYGLSFMGKKWDYDVPAVEVWAECLRVLKPGGHLLAFAGTRTQHRMAVRIEDAGFEIRDMIAWVYGSGFPKSLDVSKAIDKAAGAERKVVGVKAVGCGNGRGDGFNHDGDASGLPVTEPATNDARDWQGWGTALKPALEPITVARKPLAGTVAANVLKHGTGALNIDGCRVGMSDADAAYIGERIGGFNATKSIGGNGAYSGGETMDRAASYDASKGRWPANLIHDGSEEVLLAFPSAPGQQGPISSTAPSAKTSNVYGAMKREGEASQEKRYADRGGTTFSMLPGARRLDQGSAARFFYCAKASKADRDAGLDAFEEQQAGVKNESGRGFSESDPYAKVMRKNIHPTVKPTDLCRYLQRLVTPPGGTTMDIYMGSGSFGKSAILEGFEFIGIERDEDEHGNSLGYMDISRARIEHACAIVDAERMAAAKPTPQLDLFTA